MGWSTTVVFHNDNIGKMKEDPDFAKKLESAILSAGPRNQKVNVIVRGKFCTASVATVIESHHDDSMTLVAVGGGTGEVVCDYAGSYKSGKLEMLKKWAMDMGFTLRKKAKRRLFGE